MGQTKGSGLLYEPHPQKDTNENSLRGSRASHWAHSSRGDSGCPEGCATVNFAGKSLAIEFLKTVHFLQILSKISVLEIITSTSAQIEHTSINRKVSEAEQNLFNKYYLLTGV